MSLALTFILLDTLPTWAMPWTFVVLQTGVLGNAKTGLHSFNADLGDFLATVLESCVLILGGVVLSQIGGRGLQQVLRSGFWVIFLGAMFVKSWSSIATGTLALF